MNVATIAAAALSSGASHELLRDAAANGAPWIVDGAIDDAVVSRAVAAAERFFALPLASRMVIDAEPNGGVRGYRPLPERDGDLKECFFATFGVAEDAAMTTAIPGANLWPAEVPELPDALGDCARAMHEAGQRSLAVLAEALGLPSDTWASLVGGGLRVLRYPAAEERRTEGQLGANPHTDMTPFALITDDTPGLQCDCDGFRDVIAPRGALACLPGELLARWSGDAIRPVSHRVVLTPARPRISLCYFMLPELTTEIEPVRTSLDRPFVAHERVSFAEYMLMHSDAVRARK